MSVLVIAEHDHNELKSTTVSAVAAAKLCGNSVDILVMGYQCENIAKIAATLKGVSQVLLADSQSLQYGLAENATEQVLSISAGYSHILAPATTFGKSVLPRVAARLDVEFVSEVIEIVSVDTFKRAIYAGNAIATVKSIDPIKVLTIRPTVFLPEEGTGEAIIKSIETVLDTKKSTYLSREIEKSGRPDLTIAKTIVAGGQGVNSIEDFKLVEALADKLGGAVGASRAAVDAGYVKNDLQIGQTGKIVAPDLYFAVGISGAIQHIAGIKDAGTIVAINQDPDAPIFSVADYGLIGDLHTILPELIEML